MFDASAQSEMLQVIDARDEIAIGLSFALRAFETGTSLVKRKVRDPFGTGRMHDNCTRLSCGQDLHVVRRTMAAFFGGAVLAYVESGLHLDRRTNLIAS